MSSELEVMKQRITEQQQNDREVKGPIIFEAKPDPELIIKSVLEHFPYLKFRNSFRGIDNYNFASLQPWSSPCPICDGKHGNYGLHGEWNGTEYCLTCFTSSNKFKFAYSRSCETDHSTISEKILPKNRGCATCESHIY